MILHVPAAAVTGGVFTIPAAATAAAAAAGYWRDTRKGWF